MTLLLMQRLLAAQYQVLHQLLRIAHGCKQQQMCGRERSWLLHAASVSSAIGQELGHKQMPWSHGARSAGLLQALQAVPLAAAADSQAF
jgi:hypothetical protein